MVWGKLLLLSLGLHLDDHGLLDQNRLCRNNHYWVQNWNLLHDNLGLWLRHPDLRGDNLAQPAQKCCHILTIYHLLWDDIFFGVIVHHLKRKFLQNFLA